MSLVILAILIWADDVPFGPSASNQVWSTSCVAIDCPRVRFSFGTIR